MDIFSKRLKSLLNESKITMYRLAKDISVNKQTVNFWVNGLSEPKLSHIVKVAIYFDVSADYLIGLENEDGTKNTNINNSFNNFSGNGNNIKF